MNKKIVHDALVLFAFTVVLGLILGVVYGITKGCWPTSRPWPPSRPPASPIWRKSRASATPRRKCCTTPCVMVYNDFISGGAAVQ